MAMNSDSLLPYYTAQSASGVGLFNTAMGKLQRQLYKGEYDIFKFAPIFESDFIQITKRGEVIDVHNRVRMVTVGIACTSPILPLPDVMLLARPATGCEDAGRGHTAKGKSHKAAKTLELTRLLPLKFVRISVHDREKQQLRLKFATGRSCYLQLCPPLEARDDLFAYWEKLIYLLRPPVDSNSSTYAIPAEDTVYMPVFDDDRRGPAPADFQGKGDTDQVSIRSLPIVSEVSGASSTAFAGGEGIQLDPHKPPTTLAETASKTKPPAPAKEATTEVAVAGGGGSVAGALSVAATKSAGPGQGSAALAGVASRAAGKSKSSVAIAGALSTNPRSLTVAVAGTASKTSESVPSVSPSLTPEGSRSVPLVVAGELSSQTVGDPVAEAATPEPLAATSPGEQRRKQRASAGAEPRKERRERRERREKGRAATGRSSHHRRPGDSHRKTGGDKVSRKASSRRSFRDDKKGKGHGSAEGSKQRMVHKGVSRTPISKESRASQKFGRSLSTASSGSSSKRLSRISSFLRNVRANLTTKTVTSARGRDVDVVAKTVEKSNMEAIVETVEGDQGLEMVSSVTSEIIETVTLESH
ncbi:Protein FAM71A [Tupaia chinensis]|uniref:Protein FAM71A n=1 Tax=Tupaia chinensis TaxID=246437 RepID=L8YEW9_TUPCH|nr:Protein FAM71A [Tupaia chinensis]